MGKSKIDWTDYTWNPVTGCTKVSEGCRNCYAERHAKRFWGERKFTDVICHKDRLNYPFSIKQPSRIFVNSMSDLFHSVVPDGFIAQVLEVIRNCPQYQFIVLTKRPERMKYFLNKLYINHPQDNLIMGVSVEDQLTAEERIPTLFETDIKYRAISAEPLIGRIELIDLVHKLAPVDWVIVGGESGPGARPMHKLWVLDLLTKCSFLGIPFFFKQWGEFNASGERVGKAAAGHLLNGMEHHEYPHIPGFDTQEVKHE